MAVNIDGLVMTIRCLRSDDTWLSDFPHRATIDRFRELARKQPGTVSRCLGAERVAGAAVVTGGMLSLSSIFQNNAANLARWVRKARTWILDDPIASCSCHFDPERAEPPAVTAP